MNFLPGLLILRGLGLRSAELGWVRDESELASFILASPGTDRRSCICLLGDTQRLTGFLHKGMLFRQRLLPVRPQSMTEPLPLPKHVERND